LGWGLPRLEPEDEYDEALAKLDSKEADPVAEPMSMANITDNPHVTIIDIRTKVRVQFLRHIAKRFFTRI